jgi:type III secretion protein D
VAEAEAIRIRLLNGPLAGRVLRLPSGPFSIGGDQSDLALSLEGGGAATLEVSPTGVTLQDGVPCWVEGQPVRAGRLPSGRFIDLAGLHFVIGVDALDPVTLPAVARARLRRPWYWLALLLAALALTLGLAWWSLPAPAVQPPLRTWLPLAMRPFPEVQIAWLPNGALRLFGRCADSSALAELRAEVERAGVRYQWLVQCDDELLASVRALLHSYGYSDVTVTLGADRQATIQGNIRNDARFAALTDALDHLPGLAGWQTGDSTAQEFQRLLSRLRADGLLAGLSIRHGRQSWVVSGWLTPERRARLHVLLDDLLRQGVLTRPAHLADAQSMASARDFLSADIAAIDGNRAAPYLTLSNGVRLLAGASVGQAMRIEAIHPDGVSLAGRDQLVFLPAGP